MGTAAPPHVSQTQRATILELNTVVAPFRFLAQVVRLIAGAVGLAPRFFQLLAVPPLQQRDDVGGRHPPLCYRAVRREHEIGGLVVNRTMATLRQYFNMDFAKHSLNAALTTERAR